MINKLKKSTIASAVQIYIAKIGLDFSSSDISDVAEFIKISKSGVTVDPEFWIGRFHRKGKKQ